KGYPENCIATFENTLKHTSAIMEIDPRLTKDSVIVLMHDATLDRTTNGTGKVSDHTWEKLRQLKLKDTEGNVTAYGIPTLDELLEWAKGKTILVLDKKSVPTKITARKIREHGAEATAMVMAYSYDEAKLYYELNNDIMMKVFIKNMQDFEKFAKMNIPWENVLVSVPPSLREDNDNSIIQLLHEKGVMTVMVSYKMVDRAYTNGQITDLQLPKEYKEFIDLGVDIIQADLAIEAGRAIEHLVPKKSSKRKYFVKWKLEQ
ncbi:MAG TPA: glycerophosphodiester phosphodiesterase family protein, partial [Gillisia sp.]|nr:glycerophosphodiester phosphodiesterase family protein [Gillisia sp.]